MEYRELAQECGITEWQRVPALGLNERFIDDLAAAVVEAMPQLVLPGGRAINEGNAVCPGPWPGRTILSRHSIGPIPGDVPFLPPRPQPHDPSRRRDKPFAEPPGGERKRFGRNGRYNCAQVRCAEQQSEKRGQ